MCRYINDDFMLLNDTARELYHLSASPMPIIDYHCHLDPKMIADNYKFRNLSEIWLGDDHYKWRAMRGNGISEEFITGTKSDYEKFEKWAQTVQHAMRNPLYHWTHLELSRVFGVDKVLNPATAREIYDECSTKLQSSELQPQGIIRRFNVEIICTTDDPTDSLEHHQQIKANPFGTQVLPTWRPDKTMAIENIETYNNYIDTLSEASRVTIKSYDDLLMAIQNRHDYFAEAGCTLADHSMPTFYAEEYTEAEIAKIFRNIRNGKEPTTREGLKFKSALIFELAKMNHDKDWVQQFHIGAIRNNNSRMFQAIGADSGYDAINDKPCATTGHKFLDKLSTDNKLTKTILYNLNPKDSEVMATMAFTLNEGSTPGKIQYGAAWWFSDQEDGIRKHINTVSSLGLLSRFVGMLTDSRSVLSYPRHEYFRRILCNMVGEEVENGKLPRSEMPFIHQMIKDISYNNAKNYFNF